jgi:ADP-ribosyl-[dinitrogen reductase] hydrolase
MTEFVRATGREPTPTTRTYWVVPERLLAGAYPGSPKPDENRARIESLWNAGVRTFINLMAENEKHSAGQAFAPYEDIVRDLAKTSNEEVNCLRFPIRDLSVPTPDEMATILDAIDRSLARDRLAYVHCFGGIGRTGTVVCSWLLERGLATVDTVFTDISEIRYADKEAGHRRSPETPSQIEFVKSWAVRVDSARFVESRIVGCLLGGAIGDALGAPLEFLRLDEIRARFGPDGLRDLAPAYGKLGAITDDTQMTLFTAEGILRAYVRSVERGICHPPSCVHHAYFRWARTQDLPMNAEIASSDNWPDGWLVKERSLWSRRAPGNTCLAALTAAIKTGDLPANNSKGCGTVMRVAPVGLTCVATTSDGHYPAFDFGVEISRLTHGHPTGYLAGGYLAQVIALLMTGVDLRRAVAGALEPLRSHADGGEVRHAVERAVRLADAGGEPCAEFVESLGDGWVAEEAVAIAIYCALVARDFEHGVLLAANISGDSDSTASITGQLLGTIGGERVLPARWRDKVELHDVIEQVGKDLALVVAGKFKSRKGWERYPGW